MRTIKTNAISTIDIKPSSNGHGKHEREEHQPVVGIDNDVEVEELKLLDAIYDATVRAANLQREERQLNKQLEELRDELNAAREFKSTLINQLPDALLQLRDGIDSDADDTAPFDTDEPTANEWRAEQTATICNDIPRFGDKKIADLCDCYPTLGQLADARAAAINRNQHFATALPNGIGKGIADELAERLITAETGHDTPSAAEQVKQNDLSDDNQEQDDTTSTIDSPEPQSKLESLVAELKDETDLSPEMDDDEAWDEGYQAGLDEQPIEACPSSYDGEKQRDWLRGWIEGTDFGSDL